MPLALVTGASAGIGAATAAAFARQGWSLALGARRVDRLEAELEALRSLGAPDIFCARLDVCDQQSVESFCAGMRDQAGLPDCVVNNAGLARGTERVAEADGVAWREMVETNVFGVLRVTREVLPAMIERGSGHVIMIGSIAGHEGYAGGSVYCATKAATWSICRALRLETLPHGIRVTSVDPGAAETEFSVVRFSGDDERADRVYDGFEPLRGEDVAECIVFAATRPAHVNIDRLLVMPTAQADPWHTHRRGE